MTMRTIEIDFDVHQTIEAERKSFDDPPNSALRRLLDLGPPKPEPSTELTNELAAKLRGGWKSKGVTLPEGTELQVRYSEVTANGRVASGHLTFAGKAFRTPSSAVMGVVGTARGTTVSAINGWRYLYARLPERHEWTTLHSIREEGRI